MTAYRDRLNAGHYATTSSSGAAEPDDQPELDPDNLPGRHAALDQLAKDTGLTWSRDDLTVAEKQTELADHS